ncbi:glycine-rich domain-containing protein [Rhodoplanes sp. Z2-YC6860]|uniref:glycine-rich domain-containing protein n=1 Tax=Rhodoplanes sp. Z2-YC6860 TaxID=674703 RepID=UPI00078E1B5B|nr:hypothetical protein [Rhodoplanes sp. Z2-YC6860]AMN41226.1 hypothetical protein RHPLAN_27890 [Rhodoplanes sp. Z2-YC6860]
MLATANPAESAGRASTASLDFEAPYLIEKLVKDRLCANAEEADALFREVKRFLYLNRADRSRIWDMYSHRVDEVWHQFVLFTRQYMEFCERHYGIYLPHAPSNAPKPERGTFPDVPTATFAEFAARYETMYGEPLPDCWHDDRSVSLNRRVIDQRIGRLLMQETGGNLELLSGDGTVEFAINSIAVSAITFIAETGAFYVRELPGELTDEEKVALVTTLVQHRFLRVAG